MKTILTFLLLILSCLSFSQDFYNQMGSKSVPTFNESDQNANKAQKLDDIAFKTLLHIEQKSDSIFLKRLGLKENDSIAFNIRFCVLPDGSTPIDSVAINTGIKTFDNYMKLMVNSLPKFSPAVDIETEKAIHYVISLEAGFVIQKKTLKSLYTEELRPKETSQPKFQYVIPPLEPCNNQKSKAAETNCTYRKINDLVVSRLVNFIPKDVSFLNVMVQFKINELGKIHNVNILRPDNYPTQFNKKLTQLLMDLPKFSIDNSKHQDIVYTLPIRITISGNNNDPSNGFYKSEDLRPRYNRTTDRSRNIRDSDF
ncbi:hypothetical protein ABGT15_01050 [Flavobacterium enshiense]|uniref:hypothetical protein n=1 Tax=Flavobacterium enshiense TaxID=1341165 RepID=UPI00345D7738